MRRLAVAMAYLLASCIQLMAVPAKPGVLRHIQPDGSVVEITIRGDEFGHVMTTTDGCSVILDDSSGFLCYASYDSRGLKLNSGIPVGKDAPQNVVSASRYLPPAVWLNSSSSPSSRVSNTIGKFALRTRASDSSRRVIVLLAQFSDLKFRFQEDNFNALLNQKGYSYGGAKGSVSDYLNDQFAVDGAFKFDVAPVVTLSKPYSYYGEDDEKGWDKHPAEAVAEACILSDRNVDFSRYDYVYVFYAGASPADAGAGDDHIWPHSWSLEEAGIDLRLDGKRISDYSMSSELMVSDDDLSLVFTSIGSFCHEYGHLLGLADMYDSDYEKSGGLSDGLWKTTSLMDSGNYNDNGNTPPNFNAIELCMLGLVTPERLGVGNYELDPLSSERRVLKMDADAEGECFLFESRTSSGWDRYIGGSGLLVYHIDNSSNDAGYSTEYEEVLTAAGRWVYNEVNCNPDHPCATIVPAISSAMDVSQVFFPRGTHTSLTPSSDPPFVFWSGEKSSLSLVNIRKSSSGTVSFTVNGPLSLDFETVLQDGVIVNLHTDTDGLKDEILHARVWDGASPVCTATLAPYESGKYSYVAENLKPGQEYKLELFYLMDGVVAHSINISFTTLKTNGLPYIYMGPSVRRNSTFSILNKLPLKVFNAVNVKDISWYFDDESISVQSDGYYHLEKDGELKAVVTYNDGSSDVIVRKTFVK